MEVQELMTRSVKSCSLDDSLDRVVRLMHEADLGCVPVLDQASHLAGIVTDRDICMAAYRQAQLLSAIPVKSAMTKPVISCRGSDEVAVAEHLMQEHQIRRLPVVDNMDSLIGIITLADLSQQASNERIKAKPNIAPDEVVDTLTKVTTPRPRRKRTSTRIKPKVAGKTRRRWVES